MKERVPIVRVTWREFSVLVAGYGYKKKPPSRVNLIEALRALVGPKLAERVQPGIRIVPQNGDVAEDDRFGFEDRD